MKKDDEEPRGFPASIVRDATQMVVDYLRTKGKLDPDSNRDVLLTPYELTELVARTIFVEKHAASDCALSIASTAADRMPPFPDLEQAEVVGLTIEAITTVISTRILGDLAEAAQ